MEKLKSITIIFLLSVGLLSSAAPAKTVSVLLQEGLYAEEIEGNLDAAIKIYEQVISESKETQRTAAQATYRIGMCFLKKGEKAKAAERFRNLISKFPEQQTLGTRAREQLEKLGPAFMGSIDSAEFFPVDQLIKSGKVPAFKTQIYDNTGLDLETGVSVPFMDEWPALCDVAWDNDGGGALMIKPRSSVRFLALGAAEKWEDAISMARNSLDVLRTSTSKGMFASQSKFAAVLTCEGNLAVIQIGEYDANKGTIYGWVEKIPAWVRGFGPVMERVINDNGEEKHWLIDFETGRLFSPSTETRSEEAFSRWIAENRIDAMGETRTSSPGLYGFDMEAIPIAAETWETISPKGLADALSIAKSGIRTVMSARGKLPLTYTFKTREGGMGVVQILEMQYKTKPRYFRIRYKMLRPAAMKETVKLNVGKPAYEWWTSEPSVTKTMYEGSELEIGWETDPKTSERIQSFAVGVMPLETDLSDLDGHMWFVRNLAFTVRRTPYGKKWRGVCFTMDPKRLHSGQYRVYVCAFDTTTKGKIWADMLRNHLVGATTAKLIVKPRPITQIATPREAESVSKLKQLGLAVAMFVNDHNSKLPDTLQELEPYIGKKQDFQWILDNVEYLDKGKKARTPPDAVIAYDRTLLKKGNGTNVLFNDHHVGFRTPKQLEELGITPDLTAKPRHFRIRYKMLQKEKAKSPIDLSTPEATIKSFVKAVYDGNLEAAGACVSKDGADYDEFKEMLATESNHPFQAMIKAMDISVPVEITSKSIKDGRCKISWLFMLGRVYYFGDTKMKKGTHQEFSSYLELVGDKWLIRDI